MSRHHSTSLFVVLCVLYSISILHAQSPDTSSLLSVDRAHIISIVNSRKQVQKNVRLFRDELFAWYNVLHRNPELGGQEKKTATFIAKTLEGFGWTVHKSIGGGNSLIATLERKKDGLSVLIKVDMDALPYVDRTRKETSEPIQTRLSTGLVAYAMHGAGNDAHMAIGLGLAKILAEQKIPLAGKFTLVFQSSEYSTTQGFAHGAEIVLHNNLLNDIHPDICIGFQVDPRLLAGQVGIKEGFSMPRQTLFTVDLYPDYYKKRARFSENTNQLYTAFSQLVVPLKQIAYDEQLYYRENAGIELNALSGTAFIDVPAQSLQLSGFVWSYSDEVLCHIQDRMSIAVDASASSLGVVAIPSFFDYRPTLQNSTLLTRTLVSYDNLLGEIVPLVASHYRNNSLSMYAKRMQSESLHIYLGGSAKETRPILSIPSDYFELDEVALESGLFSMYQLLHVISKAKRQ